MNIAIAGNPETNAKTIKDLADRFTDVGISVKHPLPDGLTQEEGDELIQAFKRIDWSDILIVIPRNSLNLDYSISAEIAYAKHVGKTTLLYYS